MDIGGNQPGNLRFTAVVINGFIFWDITPYSPAKVSACFGRTSRLHLQCRRVSQPRNRQQAVGFQQTTKRYVSGGVKQRFQFFPELLVLALFSSLLLLFFILFPSHISSPFQIPVYCGASRALLVTPPIGDFFGKDGLGDFVYPDPPNPADYVKKEQAAVALVRLASQYPSMCAVAARSSPYPTAPPTIHRSRAIRVGLDPSLYFGFPCQFLYHHLLHIH
jgi:hypothetical protein